MITENAATGIAALTPDAIYDAAKRWTGQAPSSYIFDKRFVLPLEQLRDMVRSIPRPLSAIATHTISTARSRSRRSWASPSPASGHRSRRPAQGHRRGRGGLPLALEQAAPYLTENDWHRRPAGHSGHA
jgi:hypothetical protein